MTPAVPMTVRRFEWQLQVLGPAVSTWPAPDRAAAMALLRRHDGARDRLAAALQAMEDEPAGTPDAPALVRMERHVRARVARRATAAPAWRWGVRSGALAACLAAGLWAGGLPDTEHDPLATVQVAALEAMQ